MTELNDPTAAMTTNLKTVDGLMREITGDHTRDFVLVKMAVAQVSATCALVHAVRELAATLESGASDHPRIRTPPRRRPRPMTETAEEPGTPVQVVMPDGLLPRLAEPLATIGMRLYQLPMRDGPTLMIGADLSELRDDGAGPAITTKDVLDAWSLAVGFLAETGQKAKRPRGRKRKAVRDAA